MLAVAVAVGALLSFALIKAQNHVGCSVTEAHGHRGHLSRIEDICRSVSLKSADSAVVVLSLWEISCIIFARIQPRG